MSDDFYLCHEHAKNGAGLEEPFLFGLIGQRYEQIVTGLALAMPIKAC